MCDNTPVAARPFCIGTPCRHNKQPMRATLLLLLISAAVAAAALELHVPLDRVSVRSPTRWIALNGTSQQLPF
jgi:hypothetical protein